MSRNAMIAAAGGIVVAIMIAWLLVAGASEDAAGPAPDGAPAAAGATEGETSARRIPVRLFYVAENGGSLMSVERDVLFAEDPVEQAREIVRAQIEAPESSLVAAVPAGTSLRALFLTERGEAFVDLSQEVSTGHSGGSNAELLTIYAIVHALTTNLPAITAVQILVDGREVDTLAGHVNLRRPFAPNPDWIQ